MLLSTRIILHRTTENIGDVPLWSGGCYRIPLTGERVTFDTKSGPRTYKVSRVTSDVSRALYVVEVVKVEDVYVD